MVVVIPSEIRDAPAPRRKPVSNSLLVAANVVAFTLGWSQSWHIAPGTGWWSILGYGFAHATPWHLIGNMFVLLMVGNPVNRRLGNGWYALLYLGTLLTLGLLGRFSGQGPLLGSSGAIFAVVAAFLMLMPAASVRLSYVALFPFTVLVGLIRRPADWLDWFLVWGQLWARAWWCFLLVPVMELWSLLAWRYSLGFWNWNHPAHLLGFLCGVLLVAAFPPRITMGARARYS